VVPLFEFRDNALRWRPSPRSLWDVGAFVGMVSYKGVVLRATFDYEGANAAIAARGGGAAEAEGMAWGSGTSSPASQASGGDVPSFAVSSGGYVPYVVGGEMGGSGGAGSEVGEELSGRMLGLRLSPARAVHAELEAAAGASAYYGLRTEECGESGVYVDWREVALRADGERGRSQNAEWRGFETYADAVVYVGVGAGGAGIGPGGGEARAADLQPGGNRRGSVTRATLMREKLSANRVGQILRCIRGECGLDRDDGSLTLCRSGCGRGLHVEACAQLARGYAAVGNFTCDDCRLTAERVEPAGVGEESVLRRTVVMTMLLELGQGKEATTAGYAEYVRLEERYVLGMGQLLDGNMLRPRDSAASFKNFVTWFVLGADRALSLESMVRSAGAFFMKVPGLVDWTKEASVKAHLKELLLATGVEHEPSTAATARMLHLLVKDRGLIDVRYGRYLVGAREKVQFVCEGVGGCRVGEVAGIAMGCWRTRCQLWRTRRGWRARWGRAWWWRSSFTRRRGLRAISSWRQGRRPRGSRWPRSS
jgi:hypothetical protein